MRPIDRRSVLKAMAGMGAMGVAGSTLGRAGNSLALAGSARALLAPGSRPFPTLPAGTDTLPQIRHIVALMMENHTYDSYFGTLAKNATSAPTDGLPDGLTFDASGRATNFCPNANGKPVLVTPATTTCQVGYSVGNGWDSGHQSWDQGKMDGFVVAQGDGPMTYWTKDLLPFTNALGTTFPTCARYYSSVMAQTYPNRRFFTAGTALGIVGDPLPGPSDPPPPNGTIFDTLSQHGVPWKDYFIDAPTAALWPYVLEKYPEHMVPVADFFADCAAGTLPGYSIIDPEVFALISDESPDDISSGQTYIEQIVNAVMRGPAWKHTMLIVTYDEGGGYYDHIPPARVPAPDGVLPEVTDFYGDYYTYTGFRVPTVVVSAWAKPGYVSHVVCDHTSILKTVEIKWNLPALTIRDANANTLLDCLDLSAANPPFLNPPTLAEAQLPTSTAMCVAEDPKSYVP